MEFRWMRPLLLVCLLPVSNVALAQDQPTGGTGSPKKTTLLEFDLPLNEGDPKVTGRTDADEVIVRIYSGWRPSRVNASSDAAATTRISEAAAIPSLATALRCQLDEPLSTAGPQKVTNGRFEVLLRQRLNAGDCVVVADTNVNPFQVSALARSVLVDLGRMRGYFSLGGAISQNRSSFSQVDTFVGFTTDARILGNVFEKPRLHLGEQAPSLVMAKRRAQINGFTDARVGFRLATTGEGGASPMVASGSQPVDAPFQRPDQLLFNSDQPGYFQVGLHAPLSGSGMDWRNDGKQYSFYVGPVIKYGVQALDSSLVVSRVVEIDKTKAETDTARFRTKSEQLRRGALPFWGYGFRFGVYGYDLLGRDLQHRQVANDPIGYLDFTFGKASAYRTYTFTRSLNEAKTVETVEINSLVRRRLAIEGRLKIPSLPALIGIDINVRSIDRDDEPNDFRFVLAFRVDAQKALARIFDNDSLMQQQ